MGCIRLFYFLGRFFLFVIGMYSSARHFNVFLDARLFIVFYVLTLFCDLKVDSSSPVFAIAFHTARTVDEITKVTIRRPSDVFLELNVTFRFQCFYNTHKLYIMTSVTHSV